MVDLITKFFIIMSAVFEFLFFVSFLFTNWKKKELGAYVFRQDLGISIILIFSLIVVFIPHYPKDTIRPTSWFIIMMIMGDKYRIFLTQQLRNSKGGPPPVGEDPPNVTAISLGSVSQRQGRHRRPHQ